MGGQSSVVRGVRQGRGGRGGKDGREFSFLTAWWMKLSFSLLVLAWRLCSLLPDGSRLKKLCVGQIKKLCVSQIKYCYFPLIHKPTRVKENSATLIDNILTNYLSEGIKSGVLCSDLYDHFPIFHYSEIRVNRVKTIKINSAKENYE